MEHEAPTYKKMKYFCFLLWQHLMLQKKAKARPFLHCVIFWHFLFLFCCWVLYFLLFVLLVARRVPLFINPTDHTVSRHMTVLYHSLSQVGFWSRTSSYCPLPPVRERCRSAKGRGMHGSLTSTIMFWYSVGIGVCATSSSSCRQYLLISKAECMHKGHL